ncbi:helix-turn-helix transcriptional regulator [Parageobacillus thermoglucosidasius]|uniref:helix-turn-helix domain-containing protein n=1 Tax=Parageobacillus thermoglucosidasius TaxID=1426 RepID=UPI002E1B909E|nr:helix-turn-helix transcriptional regulator [Parageobacillus thermoglucosidasius]MED4946461.1 helix-turn-helix transcriptional regulator [Parageobacillus thermoglucosidasius]MED4984022.1 helix-turn-helix transcriptional regulator [Parageobacillus thermoglucosidasius]
MDKDIKIEMGRRLRELRKKHGLYASDVAKKLNIHRSTYTNYETGGRTPDPEKLIKLAEMFNTTVDYLTCKVDDPNKKDTLEEIEMTELLKNVKKITWDGKELTEQQMTVIAKLIEAYLENSTSSN